MISKFSLPIRRVGMLGLCFRAWTFCSCRTSPTPGCNLDGSRGLTCTSFSPDSSSQATAVPRPSNARFCDRPSLVTLSILIMDQCRQALTNAHKQFDFLTVSWEQGSCQEEHKSTLFSQTRNHRFAHQVNDFFYQNQKDKNELVARPVLVQVDTSTPHRWGWGDPTTKGTEGPLLVIFLFSPASVSGSRARPR